MIKDKIVLRILNVIMLIAFGIMLLLDVSNIYNGFYDKWYLIVLIYIICNLLAMSLLKKSSTYIILTCLFVGLFFSISIPTHNVNIQWYKVAPLILTGLGVGFLISYICTRRKIGLLKIGFFSLILSIISLCGFLFNNWKYMLPIALIMIAVYIAISIIFIIRKIKKNNDEDIYVRPSNEKNEV